ncbi:MAG: hypothetical protein WA988_08365 [Candidatus Nanopelagicales bacterium]
MYPAWQKVQKATQGEFFKPLVGQLGNIKSLLPTVSKLLTSAAGAVGRVAARGIEMMSSGPWQASFAKLANTNVEVIENLGDAALSVVDGFRKIADAATPLTKFVGSAVKGLADDFNGWTDTLNEGSFSKGQTRLAQFISIFKSFGSVIKSVFSAAGDTTDWLMNRFESISKTWANVTKNASQDGGKLKAFFDGLKPVMSGLRPGKWCT